MTLTQLKYAIYLSDAKSVTALFSKYMGVVKICTLIKFIIKYKWSDLMSKRNYGKKLGFMTRAVHTGS